MRKIEPYDKLLPWDSHSRSSEKCFALHLCEICSSEDNVSLQGVPDLETLVVLPLNAPRCISRSIDIHQIVEHAKESINNLLHHNQEVLWETKGCNQWEEKVSIFGTSFNVKQCIVFHLAMLSDVDLLNVISFVRYII